MYERGDLAGRRVFILGDDDGLSLALGLTGLPERIAVAEIDERIVEFISLTARKRGLAIEVLHYNAADPLPAALRSRFDVFVTDPVETPKGFIATISRGLAALRHPGAMYFGLTELECPPGRWHAFQKMLNGSGFALTDILRDHTHYVEGAEVGMRKLRAQAPFPIEKAESLAWYRSSFIRAITFKGPLPIIKGRVRFDRSFYDDSYILTL